VRPRTGLLSVLTPVWEGTPLPYFRLLAESVIQQNSAGAAEWVILDNGCQNPEILAYLAALSSNILGESHPFGNKRRHHWWHALCLEAATGRYILPVDSDDWLYPDCLQIVTWWIRNKGFPRFSIPTKTSSLATTPCSLI
jgi:glycosyltransferase involved in cell wall biosynthesis